MEIVSLCAKGINMKRYTDLRSGYYKMNGRMGQLLTMLFLIECGILKGTTVNISRVLHLQQFRYFSGMASIEISGTYEKWVRFFLEALLSVISR